MEFTQAQVAQTLAAHRVMVNDYGRWKCSCGLPIMGKGRWDKHFMAELVLLWTKTP